MVKLHRASDYYDPPSFHDITAGLGWRTCSEEEFEEIQAAVNTFNWHSKRDSTIVLLTSAEQSEEGAELQTLLSDHKKYMNLIAEKEEKKKKDAEAAKAKKEEMLVPRNSSNWKS